MRLITTYPKGFTLIEIILVVLLLSVVVGLTIPNFSQTFTKTQLQKCAQDLVYTMRYAQSRATTKNRRVQLVFNTDFSQYWLSDFLEDSRGSSDPSQKISGKMGRIFKIPSQIIIELGQNTITFYPDGSIEKERVYVCLSPSDKKEDLCLTISTKEQRGFVRIYDFRLE